MRRLLLVLLLALPLYGADHPVACGSSLATLQAAINAAATSPGDTVTITANSAGQCTITGTTLNFPQVTVAHPTLEAQLHVTLTGGVVTGCVIDNGGTGYTIAPSVVIYSRHGTGATAHTTISGGAVNTCVVDTGGSDYTGSPTTVARSTENFVEVRTSAFASLPAAGRRYDPSVHTTVSPKITLSSTSPITYDSGTSTFYSGASYWKVRGIEWTISNAGVVSVFAALTNTKHIIWDQNYFYPQPCPNNTPPYNTNGRIVWAVSGYDTEITNNYYDCGWGTPPGAVVGSTGIDSMGVLCDSYCQGMKIDNNYITGWFNGIFLGGSDPPPSPTGHAAISTNGTGTVGLASPPASVGLMALELGFESNTLNISSISRDAFNKVTVVTTTPHGYLTGALVYPKGVTYGGATPFNVQYDGSGAAPCTVKGADSGCRSITVVNATTFTYSQAGEAGTGTGGQIVPTTCQRGPAYPCMMDVVVTSIVGSTVNFSQGYPAPFAFGTWDLLQYNPGLKALVGGDARWAGPQPTDVEITRNQFHRDFTFDSWVATNNGNVGKGCPGEFKIYNGGIMTGNICEGFPLNTINFNGNTQYGMAPWVTITDVKVQDNWMKNFIKAMNITMLEYDPITAGDNISLRNNLFQIADNNDLSHANSTQAAIVGISNTANIDIVHNTILTGFNFSTAPCPIPNANGDCYSIKTGTIQNPSDYTFPMVKPNVTYKDNLIGAGNYGYQCGISGNDPNSSCETRTETNNLLVANSSGTCILGSTCPWTVNQFPWTTSTNASPPGQPTFCGSYPCMVSAWSGVYMTDPQNGKFKLLNTSPGYLAASDGTDIGANYDNINTALGPDNPHIPTTTPPPTGPSKMRGVKAKGVIFK